MPACGNCGAECGPIVGRSAEDAREEAARLFDGPIPEAEERAICGGCWPRFVTWMERTYGPPPWPAEEPTTPQGD